MRDHFRAFARVFALSVALCALPVTVASWLVTRLGCGGGPDDAFIAYCQTDKFGDYEHGAYALGLNARAIEHLRKAQVLILGNSRTQFGFSTEAVRAFFHDRGVPHYVFGFAYGELSPFTEYLLRQEELRPKVLIINADPFFGMQMSQPAKDVIKPTLGIWLNYTLKSTLNFVRHICGIVPILCWGRYNSIYRSSEDGHWIWTKTFISKRLPVKVGHQKQAEVPPGAIEAVKIFATEFVTRTPVDLQCNILTAAPNIFADFDPLARAVASHIRAPVVLPQVEDLHTIDGSHLTLTSAERWSSAVLREAGPIIDRCLSASALGAPW